MWGVTPMLFAIGFTHWRRGIFKHTSVVAPFHHRGDIHPRFMELLNLVNDDDSELLRDTTSVECLTITDGWKLSLRCGQDIRAEMGWPTRSSANVRIAVQRCNSWIKENCPSLRAAHRQTVLHRAVLYVFLPSTDEVNTVMLLQSPEVVQRCALASLNHRIPEYVEEWGSDHISSYIPAMPDF